MRQKLPNKVWLQVTLLAAMMSYVFAGTAWGQSDKSAVYTSNVTLPTSGTNVSSCKVIIDGNEYNGTKLGKNGSGASTTISVPSGTKYIHLHIAAWKGKTVTLTVKNGTTTLLNAVSVTSDDGVSNSSPFTLSTLSKATTDYYKVITLSNTLTSNTNITIQANSERAVFWGVNTEEETTGPIDLTTFSFEQDAPSVQLQKGNGYYEASYTQTISYSPNTYTGTITYSVDEQNSILPNDWIVEVNNQGEVTIAGSTNEGASIIIKASGTAVDGLFNKPTDATYTLTVTPYTINLPTFSQVSGAVTYGTNITLTAPTGCAVYYTTDGTDPTTSATAMDSGESTSVNVTINSNNFTIKAVSFDGDNFSEVVSQTYTLEAPSAPTFSIESGAVKSGTIASITGTGYIIYTLNGTDPSYEDYINGVDGVNVYDTPITITTETTIKAIAVDGAGTSSTIATATYTISHGVVEDDEKVTFDFTNKDLWSLPTDYVTTEATYESDGYTISINAPAGHKWNSYTDALLLGKQDATLTLPAFSFPTEKIKVYGGGNNASASTTMNFFVGDQTVSTSATSSKVDHEFIIADNYQAAGNVYVFKVTNDNNAQIKKIEIFKKDNSHADAELTVNGNSSMDVTTTQKLNVTCKSDGSISYESSNTDILTVDNEGNVTAVGLGTATITVSVPKTESFFADEATFEITVTSKASVDPVGPSTTGGNFVKVTDVSSLKDGDKIMLVWKGTYTGANNATLNAHHAMSSTQATNNRPAVEVTFSNDGNEITDWTNAQIIELEKSGNFWYFNVGDSKYLYAASSSSNHLKSNEKTTVGDDGKATITFDNGDATIIFQGTNSRNTLLFNPNLSAGSFSPLFSCYGSKTDANRYPMIYRQVSAATEFGITIGKNGWKTLVASQNFAVPEGVTAYKVTGSTDSSVHLEEIKTGVKKNVPVVLKGTANETYTVSIADEANCDDNSDNLLQISTNTTGNGVYVLATKGDKTGWYKWAGGSLGAGRVYLPASTGAGAREFLSLDFDDNTTTGIDDMNVNPILPDSTVFDMQGRKVNHLKKGSLYIMNGKKVVIK